MKNPVLRTIATAVPGPPHDQRELEEFMRRFHALEGAPARRLRTLYRRSAIGSRHSCLVRDWNGDDSTAFFVPRSNGTGSIPTTADRMQVYRREAPRLAIEAARRALTGPGAPAPDTIDHLFVVSCTGFHAPGLDVDLTAALDLRPDVGRTLIGFQGCQGGLAALRLASSFCRSEPRGTALVVCVELCTIHFQHEPTDENLLANALFADGAAAAVVTGADVASPLPSLRIEAVATALHPEARDGMTWRVGDTGFSLGLSSRLPHAVRTHVRGILEGSLGLTPEEIRREGFWAVHPGGAAILDQVSRALGLAEDALAPSRDVLRRFGNMSSPTVFFVLERILASRPAGDTGVALAFGPGLSIEAARLRRSTT